jgi:hypothetical protein
MSLMRFFVRQFSGQRFTDTSSGFRGFSRDVLELFAREYPSEYMESVEALLLASAQGFRVDEVPITMHNREQASPRTSGSSSCTTTRGCCWSSPSPPRRVRPRRPQPQGQA